MARRGWATGFPTSETPETGRIAPREGKGALRPSAARGGGPPPQRPNAPAGTSGQFAGHPRRRAALVGWLGGEKVGSPVGLGCSHLVGRFGYRI